MLLSGPRIVKYMAPQPSTPDSSPALYAQVPHDFAMQVAIVCRPRNPICSCEHSEPGMTPVLLREVRLLYHENAFRRTWVHDQSGIFDGSSLGFTRTSVLHQVKALTERRSSTIPQGKPAIGSRQLQGVPNAQVQFHSAGQEQMVGHPT